MRRDKLYVCVKGPQSGSSIDMALSVNQVIQDFIDICKDVLEEEVFMVSLNHPFRSENKILNLKDTFAEAGVANGDILILS